MVLDLAPGTVFGDDFRVVSPLSRGGMGAVYVVEQISTNKRRALKLMLEARSGDAEMRRRFAQEARVGSLVASEHVVDVIAAGLDTKTGIPWLAMELLDGEDLAAFADRRGALPPAEVAEIFAQLCHALGAAHDIPVVHRDLKPGNVFLARPRLAEARFILKVLDFGIAKIMGSDASTTKAVGTPLWMAPEQTQAGAKISPATDVWALGLMAFFLLTGRLYWKSANELEPQGIVVMREILFDPLAPASERARELGGAPVPQGFDAWFARVVAREPAARPPNARDAWAQLSPILGAPSKAGIQIVPRGVGDTGPRPGELSATVSAQTPPPPATPAPPAPPATLAPIGNTLGAAAVPGASAPRAGRRFAMVAGLTVLALTVGGTAFYFRRSANPVQNVAGSSAPSTTAPPEQPVAPPPASASPSASTPAAAIRDPLPAPSALPSSLPRHPKPVPTPARPTGSPPAPSTATTPQPKPAPTPVSI